MVSAGRLLTKRPRDLQAWDVAPPISLQLVTFMAVNYDRISCKSHVACCNLQLATCKFYRSCDNGLTEREEYSMQWRTQDFRMGGVEVPQAPRG